LFVAHIFLPLQAKGEVTGCKEKITQLETQRKEQSEQVSQLKNKVKDVERQLADKVSIIALLLSMKCLHRGTCEI
jgi:wobble nucleotide-excising tRNase